MNGARQYEYGLITARLLLDIMRCVSVVFLSEDSASLSHDFAIICVGLFIGQAEGKPMTAAKLASYIGMPRPTLIRKLRELHRSGIAKQAMKGWHINTDNPQVRARLDACKSETLHLLRKATAELSRLDSMAIERRKAGT